MTKSLVPPLDQTYSTRKLAILTLIVALPAVLLTMLVVAHWVNVPHWDQWDESYIFAHAGEGKLTLGELVCQQNESRPIVPRLWFIGLAFLTHWDVRFEMACSILLSALLSYLLYRQALATVSADKACVLWLMVPVNMLVFTPVMHENWLNGYYMQIFIPGLCMLGCIRIAYSRIVPARALLLCLALALTATFSFSSGILLWITAYLAQWLRDFERPAEGKNERRARVLRLVIWVSFALVTLVLYFHTWTRPYGHPPWSKALENPLDTLHYALVFLGGPLGPALPFERIPADTAMGVVFCLGWLGAAALLLRFRHAVALRRRVWGWVVLGVYVFGCSATSAIGRIGFGVNQATASRYCVHSLLGWVALIFLGAIIIDHLRTSTADRQHRRRLASVGVILAGVLLLAECLCLPNGFYAFGISRDRRVRAKAALELVFLVPHSATIDYNYPHYDWIRMLAEPLDRLGWLNPPLLREPDFRAIEKRGDLAYGKLEKIEYLNSHRVKISGWARLPERGETPDAVVLTYINTKGQEVPFIMATTRNQRPDLKMALGTEPNWGWGWEVECELDEIPMAVRWGDTDIQAWAFDGLTQQAARLIPSLELPAPPAE